MLSVGIVSFGFNDKRESKKLAQRIKTVTRRLQSYNHSVTFNRIEAAEFTLSNPKEKQHWIKLVADQDGFIFLVPSHSELIKDDIVHSLHNCSHTLNNKPLLIIYFGVENKSGDNLDIIDLTRSYDMPVLYKTVELPFLDQSKAAEFDLFQKIESDTLVEIEKLLYWTMGMNYTRNVIRSDESDPSSSS